MKQNIHIWFALLFFGLLIIGLVDKAQAMTSEPIYTKSETIDCALVDGVRDCDAQRFSDGRSANQIVADRAEEHRDECLSVAAYCQVEVTQTQGNLQAIGTMYGYESPPYCEDVWTHEGSDKTECGSCDVAGGWIPATGPYSPGSATGVEAPNQCMKNREPNECKFLGKYEVETAQGAFCVDQCAGIGDGGYCIDEAEKDPDEPQCGPDHPEFKGVAGYGGEAVLICGDPQNNCKALGDGYTWGVVEKNGTTVESCFPNAYNPPQCSGTDVLKKDQWGGFACLPLRKPGDNTEPGGENDPNNGDSDGDGQGDITGITGQLQDIKKLLGRGNTNTDNLNETLKGLGNQIKDGTKAITDAIGNIPGGGGGGGTGDGDGEQETPINWSGDPIDLKIGDGLEELNAIQGEYENLIANIRSEMASSFGSFTGGGGLEDNNVTLYGETFNAGLSKFGAHLSIVGSIILFAAAFIGLGIVMGAKD